MTNHSKLHNPKYVGPGTWFTIHSLAAWAKTPEQKKVVIEQIKYMQSHFPCGDCKVHFGDYIVNHPMEITINGNEDALFLWTVDFHNAVNYRLGKDQVSFKEAKSIFYDDSVYCSAKCDEEAETPKPTGPKIVPVDYPGYIF